MIAPQVYVVCISILMVGERALLSPILNGFVTGIGGKLAQHEKREFMDVDAFYQRAHRRA